jgi:hypothetical protein
MTTVRDPVEKMPVLHAPLFAVAECVTLSPFVQVTLSPTLTVTLGGSNAKLLIATAALAASAAVTSAAERLARTRMATNIAVE